MLEVQLERWHLGNFWYLLYIGLFVASVGLVKRGGVGLELEFDGRDSLHLLMLRW